MGVLQSSGSDGSISYLLQLVKCPGMQRSNAASKLTNYILRINALVDGRAAVGIRAALDLLLEPYFALLFLLQFLPQGFLLLFLQSLCPIVVFAAQRCVVHLVTKAFFVLTRFAVKVETVTGRLDLATAAPWAPMKVFVGVEGLV
jgi:hypothetical protein